MSQALRQAAGKQKQLEWPIYSLVGPEEHLYFTTVRRERLEIRRHGLVNLSVVAE